MNIYSLVEENYDILNDNDVYIWQYIHHHKEEVQKTSVQNLAKMCNVSHTSIIRFCKKIGLDGFAELKFHIKMQLEKEIKIDPRIVFKTTKELQTTVSDYEEKEVTSVLEKIYCANRIFIYTTGEVQYNAALEFKREFSYTNKHIYVLESSNEVDLLIPSLAKGDLFIVISFLGDNPRMISNVKKIKEINIPVIGIAKVGKNRLSKYSDNYLGFHSSNYESSYSKIKYTCNAHYFIIIGILFVRYLEQYNDA